MESWTNVPPLFSKHTFPAPTAGGSCLSVEKKLLETPELLKDTVAPKLWPSLGRFVEGAWRMAMAWCGQTWLGETSIFWRFRAVLNEPWLGKFNRNMRGLNQQPKGC